MTTENPENHPTDGDDSVVEVEMEDNTSIHLSRAPPSTRKRKRKKKESPAQLAFERIISKAESYELQDPYRGLSSFLSDSSTPDESHPWRKCAFGSNIVSDNETIQPHDYGENLVQSIFQSNCPSLIRWANNKSKQKTKKQRKNSSTKKTFQGRPDDDTLTCSCDYNPFCLATCGGVMNEAMSKRFNEFSGLQTSTENSNQQEVEVVDADATTTDPNSPMFAPLTRSGLKAVRRDRLVDANKIRSYLSSLLGDAASIDECVTCIQQRHESLVFSNPLSSSLEGNSMNSKRLRLSIPPGIENLGATCYLNTQLQCLAQNLVFTRGIFSWSRQHAEVEDRMTSVIRLFQQLLLRMDSGPFAVLNTLEFSNALGLDHYEQQDPNEFSRLFFDRLHTSFHAESPDSPLRDLLPRLFEGVTTYETKCLSCQATSVRKETFMDINLPIVDIIVRPEKKKKEKNGVQKLIDVMLTSNKKKDLTVQDCLDSYCTAERLEGDNQYYCDRCQTKRDAERGVSFEKLPPVLNIQLSRYVFDRVTLMKKKLGNKILLPRVLFVEGQGKVRKAGSVRHRYILTAVMRHQGTSAYSGHYVAEAVDWATGQWFEFNDEKVSCLDKGPSCSFDPNDKDAGAGDGSKDAYNLYYVDEQFLAQSVIESVQRDGPGTSKEVVTPLQSMAMERSTEYQRLTERCMEDAKTWERLDKRRHEILDSMLTGVFSRQPVDRRPSYVWVDSGELMEFFSCKMLYPSASNWKDRGLPLQYERLRCPHARRGLPPRIFRKGKMIPKWMYDALVCLLRKELGEDWCPDSPLTTDRLLCDECNEEYSDNLSKKVDRARILQRMHESLDPKMTDCDIKIGEDEVLNGESDRYEYVVSRKLVTWFRKAVDAIMKVALTTGDSEETIGRSPKCVALEGLDTLDLTFSKPDFVDGVENTTDVVNGTITCEHGKCSTLSKRSVRFVSSSTWTDIRQIFPSAIEHRRSRVGDGETQETTSLECQTCRAVEMTAAEEKKRLSDFFNPLGTLLSRRLLSQKQIVDGEADSAVPSHYRIVLNEDVDTWKSFVAHMKGKISSKEPVDFEESRCLLLPRKKWDTETILAPLAASSNSEDSDTTSFLSTVIRPAICAAHRLPVKAAVFLPGEENSRYPSISDRVSIVSDEVYQNLTSAWSSVAANSVNCIGEDLAAVMPEESIVWSHPSLAPCSCRDKVGSDNPIFLMKSSNMAMLFHLQSDVCDDIKCNTAFKEWRFAEKGVDSKVDTKSKNVSGGGKAANDPISVDSDDSLSDIGADAGVPIKVYEAKPDASIEVILNDLSLMPEAGVTDGDIRRSTRRRRNRYPSGPILAEDSVRIDLKSNVAAVRLLLMERCNNGDPFELGHAAHLVIPVPTFQSSKVDSTEPQSAEVGGGPQIVSLHLDKAPEILEEIISSTLGTKNKGHLRFLDLVIVRQSVAEDSASKDGLLDHLIALSNASQKEKPATKKRRGARVERGFTGTFLLTQPDTQQNAAAPKIEAPAQSDGSDAHGDPSNGRNTTEGTAVPARSLDSTEQHPSEDIAAETSPNSVITMHSAPSTDMKKDAHAQDDNTERMTPSDYEKGVPVPSVDLTTENKYSDGNIKLAENVCDTSRMEIDTTTSLASRVIELVKLLLARPDVQDQSVCYDAAHWVVRREKATQDCERLVDKAYDKYLDLCCGFVDGS